MRSEPLSPQEWTHRRGSQLRATHHPQSGSLCPSYTKSPPNTVLSTTHTPQGPRPQYVPRAQSATGESPRGQALMSTLERETGIHVLVLPAELHEMSWGSLMLKAESHCCVGARVSLSRLLPVHDKAQWWLWGRHNLGRLVSWLRDTPKASLNMFKSRGYLDCVHLASPPFFI